MAMTVRTNNVPRETIDAWELTDAERAEFDYLDWDALQDGTESRTFVRYQGDLIDLGDLGEGVPPELRKLGWHNWQSDSYFSGLAFRWVDDDERVIIARVYFS